MLKALIRKQYMECFRTYFVNMKTGKPRSKAGIAGMFLFFTALMLVLCGTFFGMSYLVSNQLFAMDMDWLYYVLLGLMSILLGTFGSVFSTYSTLYMAKDNELLLSMPIPPAKILFTRMTLVYGLSLLYSGCVWLPACICGWIFGSVSALAVVYQMLLLFVIALFVSVVTCILGWLVALVASRIKNKSMAVVIASLVFFGGDYYVCFNMMNLIQKLLMNVEALGEGIRRWVNVIYQLGWAAAGSTSSMLIFTGVTLVLFGLCYTVLSGTFLRITTRTQGGRSHTGKVSVKTSGLSAALLGRELRRFVSSPTYVLNAGMGIVLLLLLSAFALVKKDAMDVMLATVGEIAPFAASVLPMVIVVPVGFCVGMNFISTPSVSLEGKTLWILHSLPVTGRQVLRAKLGLHILLNLVPMLLAVAVLGWCLGLSGWTVVLCGLFFVMLNWFFGAFGLTLGVLRPNLQWTSEAMVIKQGLNSFIVVMLAFLIPLAVAFGGFLTVDILGTEGYFAAVAVLFGVLSFAMTRWLDTRGARRFEQL